MASAALVHSSSRPRQLTIHLTFIAFLRGARSIGKGGSVIRALTEETNTTIDISDDGVVTIASTSAEGMAEAKKRIENITAEVEVGQVYEGPVLKLLDFGAIVNILPGKDGLLHISEIVN